MKTIIKKVFAGGNTTKGFYSYYDNIIKPDANRVFILKGGPGVGKSTFMKKIAEDMYTRGYTLEEHYCSSSNESLDAIVIKELNIALMDGTAPHIVDPKNPGAVDEIVNLGNYWNVRELEKSKTKLLAVTKEVSTLFQRAYCYLKALDSVIEDISTIHEMSFDNYRYYQLQEKLINTVFDHKARLSKLGHIRHLFGSAITPNGVVDYLETVVGSVETIYYIKGDWGTKWSDLLGEVAHKASTMGYDVEVYHTPFAPEKIEDIVIPGLNFAMTTKDKFIDNCTGVIDLNGLLDDKIIISHQEALDFDREVYEILLNKAIESIHGAKLAHDELESFYIANMDFSEINSKRKEIIDRILEYV